MKLLLVSQIVLLAACSTSGSLSTTPATTSTVQPSPRSTATHTPSVVAILPSSTATETPIPCDPLTAEFCVTAGHFLLERPIRPPAVSSVDRTYPYASTAAGTRDPHHGVEFEASYGTPVVAARGGVVVFAGPDDTAVYSPWVGFYGNMVVIRHDSKIATLYAHLSRVEIEAGMTVQAGDPIGAVGQSGAAIGSHLHFEVRRGEIENYFSTVNPELWLVPNESNLGTLQISIVNELFQFQQAAITLQAYDHQNNLVASHYIDTYHPSLSTGEENTAIGDLAEGRYRITLIYNSHLYERWVDVQSGRLTQVVIVVK